jgi:hypothetical protein
MGVIMERDGEPWTETLHVRANTEENARRLVGRHVADEFPDVTRSAIHLCHPSDPLLRVAPKEEIVVTYGPYRRAWSDPVVAGLRGDLNA